MAFHKGTRKFYSMCNINNLSFKVITFMIIFKPRLFLDKIYIRTRKNDMDIESSYFEGVHKKTYILRSCFL